MFQTSARATQTLCLLLFQEQSWEFMRTAVSSSTFGIILI